MRMNRLIRATVTYLGDLLERSLDLDSLARGNNGARSDGLHFECLGVLRPTSCLAIDLTRPHPRS